MVHPLKKLSVGSESLRNMITVGFPLFSVTDETKALTMEEAERFHGGVRLSTGLIWTDDEFEEHRQHVMDRPLP